MENYSSRSGKQSGVIAYEIGDTFIKVQFTNKDIYTYSYNSENPSMIESMKEKAIAQLGLATFISQNRPRFE